MAQPDSSDSPKSSSFATDVFKLVSGTTLAQIIVILASPLLARLYGPGAFGLFALFTSIIGILTVVACMRYELAIMLPESDEEAASLLWLSLVLVFLVSMLTLPLAVFGEAIAELMNAPDLSGHLWFVPPAVFIGGVFLALNYWNSRTKHFGRLSVARVTSSVATTGTQVGAGFAGFVTGGSLILASVIGQAMATIVLGGQIWRDDRGLLRKSINRHGITAGFWRYKKFPLVDTWSALLNSISWQLPAFLLAAFFSPVAVGFYALSFRLIKMPMSLIGSSISQVFFQRASEARTEGTLGPLVENVFRILVVVGLFPILLVTVAGQEIFMVVLGEVWAEAGIYAQILSVWAFIWFISSPLSTLYIVLEKQDFGLKYNIANFITRLLSLIIGGLFGSVYVALALFAVSGIFVYGYLCLAMMKFADVQWSAIVRIVGSNLLLFAPAGMMLVALKLFDVSPQVLVSVACIAGLTYYAYVAHTDSQVRAAFGKFGFMEYFGAHR